MEDKNKNLDLKNQSVWKDFFTSPSDWQVSFKFLIGFLIALALSFFLPGLIKGTINIYVNVSELGESGTAQYFPWGVGTIVEIILMGPVFAMVFYYLIKMMTNKIDLEKGRNKYWLNILQALIVLSIGILIAAHFIHLMFDYANYLYRNQMGGYETTALYLFLYWADEWLGHHLIHYMYFLQLVLALCADFMINDHKKLRWDTLAITIVLGFGIFIVTGFATYEGQAANHLMILSVILLIIEVFIILIKKINPLKYPILLATIISNVIVICFYFFWILSYGFKPYYPYIYQPGELSGEFDMMDNIIWLILGAIILYGVLFSIKLISKYIKRTSKKMV
jgi:hypothetical protein